MTGLRALTPAVQQGLVQAVEKGIPLETAANLLGIGGRTVSEWLAVGEGRADTHNNGFPLSDTAREQIMLLMQEITRARAKREARLLENIVNAAETVGKSGVPEWRAGAWVLNNHPAYRRTYREHRELQVEGHTSVEIEHKMARNLPNTDLLEMADPELKALLEPKTEVIDGEYRPEG